MKKLLLAILLIFLISGKAEGQTTIDSCTFTNTGAIVDITVSNSMCETPAGNDAWTELADTCGNVYQVPATTGVRTRPQSDGSNCTMIYEAPADPSVSGTGAVIDVSANIDEAGALGTGDTQCIWTGSDTSNYYSVCPIDDAGSATRVYKMVATTSTSIGTCGSYAGDPDVDTVRLLVTEDTSIKCYDDGVESFSNTANNDLSSFTKAGIGCGMQVIGTDDCDNDYFVEDFSVIQTPPAVPRIRGRIRQTIISWEDMLNPPAYAQQVRDGRWYITPVIHVNGARVPQVAIYDDPGAPLLQDDNGNFTIPDKCRYSADIGNHDVANEWALVYTVCFDYSNIDAVNTNILIADETVDDLNTRLSAIPANRRNKIISNIEKKTGTTGLTTSNTLEEWITVLGKMIASGFTPRGTWTRR